MARALEIILTEAERVELERRARRRKIAHADAMRARVGARRDALRRRPWR